MKKANKVNLLLPLALLIIVGCQKSKYYKAGEQKACSVQEVAGGSLISCPDGSEGFVANGEQGENGENGENGLNSSFFIIEIIDPCGNESGNDEILFRTNTEQILAIGHRGARDFFTLLLPGEYRTEDGTKCYFTVNADYSVSW